MEIEIDMEWNGVAGWLVGVWSSGRFGSIQSSNGDMCKGKSKQNVKRCCRSTISDLLIIMISFSAVSLDSIFFQSLFLSFLFLS